ncbi:MAG TPA: helix-turn-helix domain-containing protein [Armatimonadota bacterium]|jgi:transcriptional regulator with XRE-family HTH domain
MSLLEYVAQRIRALRTARGLSQEALAKSLAVATNTVSRWETGAYRPSIEDLDKLARFFRVSVLEFFPQEDQPANAPVAALLRAAKDLPEQDILELRRFAEFRQAQALLRDGSKKRPGRKRKEA